MQTKFIEAHSPEGNWGKFAVCRFTGDEWARRSKVVGSSLLSTVGWGPEHYLILDLQTGEGAIMRHGGHARNDLDKHAVWVCPLFELFLEWLWDRSPLDFENLPEEIELTGVPLQMAGYRRGGPFDYETMCWRHADGSVRVDHMDARVGDYYGNEEWELSTDMGGEAIERVYHRRKATA